MLLLCPDGSRQDVKNLVLGRGSFGAPRGEKGVHISTRAVILRMSDIFPVVTISNVGSQSIVIQRRHGSEEYLKPQRSTDICAGDSFSP